MEERKHSLVIEISFFFSFSFFLEIEPQLLEMRGWKETLTATYFIPLPGPLKYTKAVINWDLILFCITSSLFYTSTLCFLQEEESPRVVCCENKGMSTNFTLIPAFVRVS